jgi:hypothetical protein
LVTVFPEKIAQSPQKNNFSHEILMDTFKATNSAKNGKSNGKHYQNNYRKHFYLFFN